MIAIVITAYNRAEPLSVLLNNLLNIKTDDDFIPLVISIDNNGTPEVNRVAELFEWPFGSKEVIVHKQKKGLVNHFIWTGDQTEKYENVIFLEDDLFVSPELYRYTKQMINFYKEDEKVAAASLYNPILFEATGTRFYQIEDGYDSYFLQQPYWGHIWIKEKWRMFRKYLDSYELKPELLPPYIAKWDKSFKKIFIQFLIETNKTVVTPRVSLVTNNGVAGLHSDGPMYQYQSPMIICEKEFKFPRYEQSSAIYDAFFELDETIFKKFNEELSHYDFDVDLNGIRTNYKRDYVLTTRRSNKPIYQFSSLMKPSELGILLSNQGQGVCLCRVADVIYEKEYEKKRRFLDISKNYYIGFYASLYIARDLFSMVFRRMRR